MRTSPIVIRAVIALGIAVLATDARAADPAPRPLTQAEYDRKIEELENAIKDLRKDTRQLQVAGEEQAKLKPIAGWDNGFFIQSPDGNNKLTVGGYVHFDGRYFLNSKDSGVSQFLFRRARLDLRGKFLKYYEFRFLPDFAGGTVVIQDAYLNVNYVPWLRVQAGKYKVPVGLERLQSANSIMFVERAQPTNLVPNRDLGFMLWGQPFYGALEYEFGIFDGVVDGGSNNGDTDFNDNKTFAGRVFLTPFKDWTVPPLRGLGFGVSGTYGRQKGAVANTQLPVYRTDGQQTYFAYAIDTPATAAGTVVANGPQVRISPQGYWYWGPAGFLWEWVQSDNDVKLASNPTETISAVAWQTAVSFVVTGEANSYQKIVPARDFDPWNFFGGAWGALELVGRYTQLAVESDVYTLGLADRNRSARKDEAWAIGANWYLNRMIRIMLDFDRSTFTGGARNGGDRPAEEVLMSRVQFVF